MTEETYVLEWSRRQQGFHIQPLADSIKGNRAAFAQNRACDYITLHIGTHEECSAAADQLRPVMRQRVEALV